MLQKWDKRENSIEANNIRNEKSPGSENKLGSVNFMAHLSPAAGCTNTKGCIGDTAVPSQKTSLGTQQQEHNFPAHTLSELCTPPTQESIFPWEGPGVSVFQQVRCSLQKSDSHKEVL